MACNDRIRFVKYRTCWAWGYGDWEYLWFHVRKGDKIREVAKERLGPIADNHNWSDKWRGIEWRLLRKVPVEYVKKEIGRYRSRQRDIKRTIVALQKLCDESE